MGMKDSLDTLGKMIDYYNEIERFTSGLSIVDFHNDIKTVRAVTNNILQIGELSKRLEYDFKKKHSTNINWDDLRLTRNLIAHDSESISHKRLWDTAKFDLKQVFGVIRIIHYDINRMINQPKHKEVSNRKHDIRVQPNKKNNSIVNTNSSNKSVNKSKRNAQDIKGDLRKDVKSNTNTNTNNIGSVDYMDYGFRDKTRHKSGSDGTVTRKNVWR